jgi:hypothetical protein
MLDSGLSVVSPGFPRPPAPWGCEISAIAGGLRRTGYQRRELFDAVDRAHHQRYLEPAQYRLVSWQVSKRRSAQCADIVGDYRLAYVGFAEWF